MKTSRSAKHRHEHHRLWVELWPFTQTLASYCRVTLRASIGCESERGLPIVVLGGIQQSTDAYPWYGGTR